MSDRHGLQTFGPIPDEWAAELASRGWKRVRVEGQQYEPVEAHARQYGLRPLWVLKSDADMMAVPAGADVEVLNEPDLAGYTPQAYRDLVLRWLPTLEAKACAVYAGCVSNQSKGNHAWLKAALANLPRSVMASGHRYPDADQNPNTPKKGYSSRQEELRGWLDAIGGRRYAMTEVGFHTQPWNTGWWLWTKRGRLSEFDVARHLAREIGWYRDAEFVIVYQLNDGPGSSFLDHYGIRSVDGRWKPAADVPRLLG